ncbi:unnamed protein product [Protopolystoma xenopodis]|uniref:Uncharacterized protein n=1 Tax=Protopolystoma xenopodis TaxID=117903 RepID=A0A448XHD5_9PLAT|nr:unnamed protein product [Protopolystoma xenopodis]
MGRYDDPDGVTLDLVTVALNSVELVQLHIGDLVKSQIVDLLQLSQPFHLNSSRKHLRHRVSKVQGHLLAGDAVRSARSPIQKSMDGVDEEEEEREKEEEYEKMAAKVCCVCRVAIVESETPGNSEPLPPRRY